jgi:signal transduction histidine kinase
VAVVRILRAHSDLALAIALTVAYLVGTALADGPTVGDPLLDTLQPDDGVVMAASSLFLLSLAARQRVPLVPLALAFVALVVSGLGGFDASPVVLVGLLLATYSVGAWTSGRVGQVGALGVGALVGLVVLRATGDGLEPREVALPAVLLVGAWLLGLAVRSIRLDRGDERVRGDTDWRDGAVASDPSGRDQAVRDIRDVIERSMSAVILGARTVRASVPRDPARAHRALDTIEAAGTEALEETQRLTGLLLSPDGAPPFEPQPGLADLDYLAEQVTQAGLPVDTRVEGQPLPLSPDLDGVAYRVVHEALMSTLHHSVEAHSSVVIRYEPDELQVEVSDDGKSLEDADAAQETAGLLAVRREVAALGGTLDAGPGERRGYWVLARLPYEPDWSAEALG